MKNLDQTFRIKRLLAERRESISSMARRLDEPFGSVANNVYGYRANPEMQAKIAGFLGQPVEQLFEGNGGESMELQHG